MAEAAFSGVKVRGQAPGARMRRARSPTVPPPQLQAWPDGKEKPMETKIVWDRDREGTPPPNSSLIPFLQLGEVANRQLEKSVRRLRETFHGRLSVEKANVLMEKYNHDHELVSSWLIEQMNEFRSEKEDVHQADPTVQDRQNVLKDRDIEEVAATISLPLTEENLRMLDDAQKGCIAKEDCQFACSTCNNVWWRRVPMRKKVSRCRKCKVKYDPVPKDKMWGDAKFQCLQCGHTFIGFAQMGTPSLCYHCGNSVLPNRILPPRRTQNERGRKNTHSCFAEDCYNRQGSSIPGTFCVHPKSRKQKNMSVVLWPSAVHESSGSTVATCLSQGSLMEDLDNLILEDLKEEAEEEEGN